MNSLKGLMSPRGDLGDMSPRGKRNEAELKELNWTREEDNRARVLRKKLGEGELGVEEECEMVKLVEREKRFLELGMGIMKDTIVVGVTVVRGVVRSPNPRTPPKCFAEIKLREVTVCGKVIKTHGNPQKFTTQARPSRPSPPSSPYLYEWGEKVRLAIPSATGDAVRVSIFVNKIVGKDKAFSLDIPVSDLRPELRSPGDQIHRVFPSTRGPGKGEVELKFELI